MEWLRWYHGAISDDKWPLIARRSGQSIAVVIAVWAALLECASQADERGDVSKFDPESIDALMQIPDGSTQAVLSALSEGKDPRIVNGKISNWSKRQPRREDGSAERAHAWRERKKYENTEQIQDKNENEQLVNASERKRTQKNTDKNREEKIDLNSKEDLDLKQDLDLVSSASATPDAGHVDDEKSFEITRKKRRISGKRLESFNRFWDDFAYKKGRAEAMDAWLDIPQLTSALVDKICGAAAREAAARSEIVSRGSTPKMAQGWITARRWEDETAERPKNKLLEAAGW